MKTHIEFIRSHSSLSVPQVMHAWELSRNGFDQCDMKKDSVWGHFTEECRTKDRDN